MSHARICGMCVCVCVYERVSRAHSLYSSTSSRHVDLVDDAAALLIRAEEIAVWRECAAGARRPAGSTMRCAFVSLAVILPHASCWVLPPVAGTQRWLGLEHHTANAYPHRRAAPCRLADDFVVERLTSIKQMYEELGARLEDPEIMADTSELLRVTRERSKLEETVETFDNYMSLEEQLTDAKEMFGETDDPEMRGMAREEVKEIEGTLEELDEKLKLLLLPTDPNDEKNCMLEIRAGTGGDEAAIWASDLAKLYTKYASGQGWATRVISQSE